MSHTVHAGKAKHGWIWIQNIREIDWEGKRSM